MGWVRRRIQAPGTLTPPSIFLAFFSQRWRVGIRILGKVTTQGQDTCRGRGDPSRCRTHKPDRAAGCDGYCRCGGGCVSTMGVAAGATVTVALPIRPKYSENDSETREELHTPTATGLTPSSVRYPGRLVSFLA